MVTAWTNLSSSSFPASQKSQLAGREEEKLVHAVTIKDDEHKLNAVSTTAEETESQKLGD
jgi:hypothetical protein